MAKTVVSDDDMARAVAAHNTVTELNCSSCRARNRVRNYEIYLGKVARCGKCGLPLDIKLEKDNRGQKA